MKKNNYLALCTLLSISFGGWCASCDNSKPSDSSLESVNVSSVESVPSTLEEISSLEESSLVVESVISSEDSSTSEEISSEIVDDTYSYDIEINEDFDFERYGFKTPTVEEKSELAAYDPISFKKSTYTTTTEKLSDGVDLVIATFELNNGAVVSPNCIVVDLNKANIVAGSYDNTTLASKYGTLSTPISQALAWERDNPGKKFVAVTNADFFGGGKCVNAFVKDGNILKAAHNYDLNDIPESKPMLFGVSSAGARIAPISTNLSTDANLKSSITKNGMTVYNANGEVKQTCSFTVDSALNTEGVGVITTTNKKTVPKGARVYLFKKLQNDKNSESELRGCVVKVADNTGSIEITNENFGYIVVGSKSTTRFNAGEYFTCIKDTILSSGGDWNYYDTILGARHSLVENGLIPSTVAKESSNGAAYRVPRTAVGITSDGKVVIVSVEDLHYNSKLGVSPCTGMNLTQLADFMRYFGCYDAANFDGGGSSQLITNNNGEYTVRTRSSDTGSYTPTSTRSVLNTIIVTTK